MLPPATQSGIFCNKMWPLPRKSVEPIAQETGTAVRALQVSFTTSGWDHDQAWERLQRRLAQVLDDLPLDDLGITSVIDEPSNRKCWLRYRA